MLALLLDNWFALRKCGYTRYILSEARCKNQPLIVGRSRQYAATTSCPTDACGPSTAGNVSHLFHL
jgi:hypothetical protein